MDSFNGDEPRQELAVYIKIPQLVEILRQKHFFSKMAIRIVRTATFT